MTPYPHRLNSCTRCDRNPSFAFKGDGANRCVRHALPTMVNVSSTPCGHTEGCGAKAGFGYPGLPVSRCNPHKKEGMVNNALRCGTAPKYVRRCKDGTSLPCETMACYRKAAFGDRVDNVARMCRLHKKPGMFNLCVKRCGAEGCAKFPSWGEAGHQVTRCRAHATPGMTDRKKRCGECTKIASFGFGGHGGPQWCKQHAVEGSENVITTRCSVDTCRKFAVVRVRGWVCREHSNK